MKKDHGLEDEEKQIFNIEISKYANLLQKKEISVKGKTKGYYGELAVEYFSLMDKESKSEGINSFNIAETFFASKKFDKSVGHYWRAIEFARQSDNESLLSKSLEGILAALNNKKTSISVKSRYLIPVYKIFLKSNQNKEKKEGAYLGLFSSYLAKKDYKNAKSVIDSYHDDFPKKIKEKEAMIAKIVDSLKTDGELTQMRNYIKDIDDDRVGVSKKI